MWRERRDVAARDALVLKYSPWARMLARDVYLRVYLMRDAWHDCTQNALLGMLDAMERFDPSVGAAFSTYARARVRGAVFDGLRVLTESRPRTEGSIPAERMESLMMNDDDDPLESFVATTAALGLGFLIEAQSIPTQVDVAGLSYYADAERDSLLHAVTRRLDQLRDRERTILTLHYYHQIPFVEIAQRLQVTKGRVSQLHRQALIQLRRLLKEGPQADDRTLETLAAR